MPAPGWKTIAVRDDIYERLSALASGLDRPINWTANRALDYVITKTTWKDGEGGDGVDSRTAEEFGLR